MLAVASSSTTSLHLRSIAVVISSRDLLQDSTHTYTRRCGEGRGCLYVLHLAQHRARQGQQLPLPDAQVRAALRHGVVE